MTTSKTVNVMLPGGLARTAALNAGLPPSTGIGQLIRAAVTMFVTGDINKALESAVRPSSAKTVGSLSRDDTHKVAAYVGDLKTELADVPNESQAIRAGLAMLNGWDKEDAMSEQFVRPMGRPRKTAMT